MKVRDNIRGGSLSKNGGQLKRLLAMVLAAVKWTIITLVCVEVTSFLVITISNFVVYGHAREGSRAVYDPYTLFLQSPGVRPTANNAASGDGKHTDAVWMFGGSTMRGSTDHDDRTIPSFLASYLNSNDSGRRFAVTNFGMNSFNSLLETKYLQKLLAESSRAPEVIIFYDGANDAKYFVEHRSPYGHHGYRRAKALIESYYRSWFGLLKPLNAALYSSFTKELYDKYAEFFTTMTPSPGELPELASLTEKRYDHVNKLAECYGAKFIVFWQPMLWVEECRVLDSVKQQERGLFISVDRLATARENLALPYRAILERLKGRAYFVDFRDILCGRVVPMYQADGVHLNDDGRRTIASNMAKEITKRLGMPAGRTDEAGRNN